MTIQPIITAKIQEFKNDFLIEGNDDVVYEKYVNYQILKQMYPESLSTDADLLDIVSVGGGDDLGIDGLIVSVNDHPVTSIEEINDIIFGTRKSLFNFTFIQSKNKKGFNHDEYQVFMAGIESFLKPELDLPANDRIKKWHEIYEYIISKDSMLRWKDCPIISTFYVTNGEWSEQPYILSDSNAFKEHIESKNTFQTPDIHYIDGKRLLDIINANENCYETIINVAASFDLPGTQGVKKSGVFLCKATDIITLISTEDGILRRYIFEDNVRDFQGNTEINKDIKQTITNNPEQFLLLNNGITVVCEDFEFANQKIRISSPQIVNGCQTCNILYESKQAAQSIESIFVIVKIIASNDNEIVNNIVKGTNRQNIVYDEAFETTKDFHKLLEKFFNTFSMESYSRLYYERRAKQFNGNPQIKPNQKVNLRIIAQSTVALFLFRPEQGIHHPSRLLRDFKDSIFVDNHSFFPYYTASFLYKQFDNLFRVNELPRELRTFIFQITYIMKESLMGSSPSLNGSTNAIEKYCRDLLDKVKEPEKFKNYALQACETFKTIRNEWIKEKGYAFQYGIKDNEAFTKYINKYLHTSIAKTEAMGIVLSVKLDRNGKFYGFIRRAPDNIFFHEDDNPGIGYNLVNKYVTYDVVNNQTIKAVNIKIKK